jgi:hypothetical protein
MRYHSQPERVTALVVQNGNAYDEGLDNDFWKPLKAYWKDRTDRNAEPLRNFLTPAATRWQYTRRIWVFWRRVLHTCHRRTQVQTWLRLAGASTPRRSTGRPAT